jgi:multidrug efflux pump subunit AcrB
MGGKTRQIQIDLDSTAMQARGLSGQDVANALAAQNLITPVGTQKIGSLEYAIQLNNAPTVIAELGDPADPQRERHDRLYPRRRDGARRQPAADQHRACRRQAARC